MSMSTKKRPRQLWHPYNWPSCLAIGTIWLITCLPYRIQFKIGAFLGRMTKRFSKKLRHTTEVNLKLCFPELSQQQRDDLLQKSFESAGIGALETGMGWWASKKKIQPLLTEITGLEHVRRCQENGEAALLLTCHFSTLELSMRLLSLQVPYVIMYREQKNPVLDALKKRAVKLYYPKGVVREDVRGFIRALQDKQLVGYTPDTDAGFKNSIFVPFFGIPTATVTATARFVAKTGARIIPMFCRRNADGSGLSVQVQPPLENYPTGDLEQDTIRINQLMEEAIRKQPDQYIWQYKRFKTRPPGEERFYSKKND